MPQRGATWEFGILISGRYQIAQTISAEHPVPLLTQLPAYTILNHVRNNSTTTTPSFGSGLRVCKIDTV